MTSLVQYEKFHRANTPRSMPALKRSEIFLSGLIVFLCGPFITAIFMMIPLIGQGLAVAAFVLTLIYLYVRRSWWVRFAVIGGYLLFAIPFLAVIQTIKHYMDVPNFFLMALGIPVTIFYIMLVAARSWFLVESSAQGQRGVQPN